MSAKENSEITIAIIGKFSHMWDEEYIALSFEMLGHEVIRIPQQSMWADMQRALISNKPDIILYTKWTCPIELKPTIEAMRRKGVRTVCWLFDLYFDYQREHHVKNHPMFKSDNVFTTDGGHQKRFEELGVNHKCVRQGIFKDECVLLPFKQIDYELIFVGSDSPIYPQRTELVKELGATWIGKKNTNELRGMALNELYSKSRIVIGDSFPSPHYWSNRVVETLGRGGFLIHKETEGLKESYPYLVTYTDKDDLKAKIEYYQEHEDERRDIIIKNHKWVLENNTMDKRCAELISWIK